VRTLKLLSDMGVSSLVLGLCWWWTFIRGLSAR
jgi:hypothetical protein